VIYFATDGDAIKIGRSQNVQARIKSLSTGNAKPLRLVASVPGGARHEAKVHADLADYRLNGEWFKDSQAIRDAIAEYQVSGIGIIPDDYQVDDDPLIVRDCRAAGLKLIEISERAGVSRMEAYERVAAKAGTNAEWLRKFLSGHRSAKEPRLSVGYALLSDAALESAGPLVVTAKAENSGAEETERADKGQVK
jgi:hypothetical protein